MFIRFFLIGLLLVSEGVFALDHSPKWSVEAEIGVAFQTRNDVRIPGDSGTDVNLKALQERAALYQRLHLDHFFSSKHQLRLIYAPLRFHGSGFLTKDVTFDTAQFNQGDFVSAGFKFNSYRLGYRYWIPMGQSWDIRVGVTGKIRDAYVSIESTSEKEKYSNLGFVPLFHVGVRGYLSPKVGIDLDVDGAWSPQGRAEDLALKMFFQMSEKLASSVGYRMLEGGADVSKVYTFAWVHYFFMSLQYSF